MPSSTTEPSATTGPASPTDPAGLVDEFNARHTTTFALGARFDSGLQGGAWSLVDGDGRRAVLKRGSPDDVEALAAAVERVRAAGYPTPPWLGCGRWSGQPYSISEFVEGRGATPLTTATVPLLLDVLERQAGVDPGRDVGWSERIARPERPDVTGRPDIAGPDIAGLVDRFDRLTAVPVVLPRTDLVHGDFNTCNVLLAGGRVSGVIDVTDMGCGTRVYDYACLLRESYVEGYGTGVTDALWRAAAAVAGHAVLAACAASAAYFIVRFKQVHEPWRMSEVVERLCRMADDLAAESRSDVQAGA
jgi:Phosphotransferase enzyme family